METNRRKEKKKERAFFEESSDVFDWRLNCVGSFFPCLFSDDIFTKIERKQEKKAFEIEIEKKSKIVTHSIQSPILSRWRLLTC